MSRIEILKSKQWYYSISKKVSKVNFFNFWLTCFLITSSQVLLFLAFLLPLKALILMGSDSLPSYIKDFGFIYDKEQLVIALSVFAFFLYLIHLGGEELIKKRIKYQAGLLTQRAKKVAIFADEADFASSSIYKIMRSYSFLGFSAAGFIYLYIFVNNLFYFCMLLLVLEAIIIVFLNRGSKLKRVTEYDKALFAIGVIASFNFFLSFCYLVYLYMDNQVESSLLAVITILVLRQLYQRLSVSLGDVLAVFRGQNKLEAIFFTHIPFIIEKKASKDSIDVAFDVRDQVEKLLIENFEKKASLSYVDTCAISIPLFSIQTEENDMLGFCRIFGKNTMQILKRELSLYGGYQAHPMLLKVQRELVGENESFLLLESDAFVKLSGARFEEELAELKFSLQLYSPPADVVSMYQRTKKGFCSGVGKEAAKNIFIGCNNQNEFDLCNRFIDNLDILNKKIQTAPVFIYNPELVTDNLIVTNGSKKLISWAGWEVLPIGASLPMSALEKPEIDKMFSTLMDNRDDVKALHYEGFIISGLLWQINHLLSRERYRTAIKILCDNEPLLIDAKISY